MGSKIVAVIALIAGFAFAGDILRNPTGTNAAASGINSLLSTSYNAAGGYQTSGGQASA